MGKDAKTRGYANGGKPAAGDGKAGPDGSHREEKALQAQTIRTDAVSRRCIADPRLRLYRYTAGGAYSRYRILGAYEEQRPFPPQTF